MNGQNKIRFISRVLSWSLLTLSLIAFVGWLIDHDALKCLFMGSVPLSPLSSISFILIATAILIPEESGRYRKLSVLLTCFTLLISTYHFWKSIFSATDIIDELFLSLFGPVGRFSYTMSTLSAFLFSLIAAVLLLKLYQKYLLKEIVLIVSMMGCVFLLTGYLFNVPEFQLTQPHFPPLPTAVLFCCAVTSIMLSQPDRGLLSLLIGPWEGAKVGRFMIPLIFIIPYTIGYFRLLVIESAVQSTEMVVAFFAFFYTLIFAAILFLVVHYLNNRDKLKKLYVEKIDALNTDLNESVNHQLALNEEFSAANEELTAMNDQLNLAMKKIQDQNLIILQQKEEALKKSQEHLDIIFSNTAEEIVLLDTQGRLIAFNRALEKFILKATGKSPKVGMLVWDMTVPERAAESKRIFQLAIAGETISVEAKMNISGEEIVHLLKYEPVFINGSVSYVSLTSSDITQLTRSHEILKRNFIELQKVNHELDRFVYSASHDLRAPLSSILGLINVAKMENPSSPLPYLNTIEDRINHLDGFIKDILNYSRNARAEINLQKINFQQLIAESNSALKLVSKYEKLAIEVNIQEETEFYSDPLRLSIVFNNIISNAFKFRDHNKENCYLSIRIAVKEDKAQLQFSDNGIGIAKEHLPKIFDMFYRGTDRSTGSGIGLYIVKETIEKLGGEITVESVLGQSTVFSISIPNTIPDQKAAILVNEQSKK